MPEPFSQLNRNGMTLVQMRRLLSTENVERIAYPSQFLSRELQLVNIAHSIKMSSKSYLQHGPAPRQGDPSSVLSVRPQLSDESCDDPQNATGGGDGNADDQGKELL